MERVEFLVQGSAIMPYNVVFLLKEKNITATCSCPAGINGLHCKHRFNIMKGIDSGIVSGNIDDVKKIESWLHGTDIEKALIDVSTKEEELEAAKAALAIAKKKLARAMRN